MKFFKYLLGILFIVASYFIAESLGKYYEEKNISVSSPSSELIGEKLPKIFVYDENGNPYLLRNTIKEIHRESIIIFYSFSCSTCLAQAKDWILFQKKYPEVKLIGIAFETKRASLTEFENRTGIEFDNWISDKSTIKKMRISLWPTFIRLNPRTMTIKKIYEGENAINQIQNNYEDNI